MACKAVRNKCQLCQKKLRVALTHRTHNMFRGIPIYSYSHCCLEYHRFDSHLYYTPTFRVNDKQVPPQDAARICCRVRACVPLVPHWCEQELQLVHPPTWQLTLLQDRLLLLRLLPHQEFDRVNKSSRQIVIKIFFMFNLMVAWFFTVRLFVCGSSAVSKWQILNHPLSYSFHTACTYL